MQRASKIKTLSVMALALLLVSTFGLLILLPKPAGADGEGGCSNVVYSVLWVKQIDTELARQLYVSAVPKGDDSSRIFVIDGYPSRVFFVRLSDGALITSSARLDKAYGGIPNDLYGGGVVSSEEGGYTAWVTASAAGDRTYNWLHVVCTGNGGKASTPAYFTFTLNGLIDPTTHKVVNLSPNNVDITQNGRYVIIAGNSGYVAVFQKTSGDDD